MMLTPWKNKIGAKHLRSLKHRVFLPFFKNELCNVQNSIKQRKNVKSASKMLQHDCNSEFPPKHG